MNKYSLKEKEKKMLTYFILTGYPKEYRMRLWILASGAYHQVKLYPDYYFQLSKLSEVVPCLYSDIIQKDIERTNTQNEEIKNKIKKILECYSIRNSSIGYCQGFNYLVLKIVVVVEDEAILYLFNIEY